MQRLVIFLALPLVGGAAWAQFSNVSSNTVTGDQLTAAIAASQSVIMAAMPTPMGSVPPNPNGAGVIGVANSFFPADDAQRQTVQRANVTTDSSGNWSVTWATPFISSSPVVNPLPLNTPGTNPFVCNVLARSSTAASGKCWQTTSQAVALISLTISLAPSNAPTSTAVMIVGGEPTQ